MADRYWIGGTGNWSDTAHWSSVTQGTPTTPGIVDSYLETNKNNDITIGATNTGVAQSFVGDGGTLNSVKFYLSKANSPTGNIVAKIYAHSGTFGTTSVPTGSALAVSSNVDASTLSSDFALITFTFSGDQKITLDNGTNYTVAVEYTGSAPNGVNVGYDFTSPTHGGNFSRLNAGNWVVDATLDTIFYIYKDETTYVGGASVPTSSDDVFIDANSGFGSGGTITLDDDAVCNNLTTSTGNSFTISGDDFNFPMGAYGSLLLESGLTIDGLTFSLLSTSTGKTITRNNATLNINMDFNGSGGSWTLQDNLTILYSISIKDGIFNANNYDITAYNFSFFTDWGDVVVNMGSGTWEATATDDTSIYIGIGAD